MTTQGSGQGALNQQQQIFVNGQYRPSSDDTQFPVTNPMTGETIYTCSSATVQDVSEAVETAHTAFKTWSRTSPSKKRAIFLKAADILETYIHGDAPDILRQEISATESWIKVNIFATAGVLRETAGLVTHIKGKLFQQIGPGPQSSAIACPLICGNTVVLKPSEKSPKSQNLVIKALTEAGLPTGCISFLPCSPARAAEITEFAVKHPKIRHVNFTGSERVGTIIAGWAASCLKKCVLELGGKAPAIVREDANLDDAVEAIVFGGLSNNGQVCMSTERVIVHKSIADEFKQKLLARVGSLKCGNHMLEKDISISGLFTPTSATRVLSLTKSAVDAGATLLLGDLQIGGPNKTIIRPHILEGVTRDMRLYHEESFGPVMVLIEFTDDEEALNLANDKIDEKASGKSVQVRIIVFTPSI
ncbi:unnamed protein product [Parascedosporium putredinis]|uniref:Aldehyde dehydrogenase domain-containing protein n=1 Tax=Parascedosporium putredinis TaxID=1442378 RepID=A0A9P1H1J7_9PEZI|nr:unnamed protein product [Parascedosporium putredinis]CAI7993864.1 unnamed protein product [Parascedosporium putredinis]